MQKVRILHYAAGSTRFVQVVKYPLSLVNPALQRQTDENLKQIFPEKEYRGLSPNIHIPVSVSELYIPTMGCLF
jgi:hypothetical protein